MSKQILYYVSFQDVYNLHTKIPNSYLHEVSDKEFNHVDFTFGRDAKTVVYDDVIKILSKYDDEDKPKFPSQGNEN